MTGIFQLYEAGQHAISTSFADRSVSVFVALKVQEVQEGESALAIADGTVDPQKPGVEAVEGLRCAGSPGLRDPLDRPMLRETPPPRWRAPTLTGESHQNAIQWMKGCSGTPSPNMIITTCRVSLVPGFDGSDGLEGVGSGATMLGARQGQVETQLPSDSGIVTTGAEAQDGDGAPAAGVPDAFQRPGGASWFTSNSSFSTISSLYEQGCGFHMLLSRWHMFVFEGVPPLCIIPEAYVLTPCLLLALGLVRHPDICSLRFGRCPVVHCSSMVITTVC